MFPNHKTKIICTIGPASEDPAVLEDMLVAGMNVARLNFSHGTFESHRSIIASLREASRATGRRVAIMGDLPGPKIRIGSLEQEPIQIEAEDTLVLTTDPVTGDANRVAVSFDPLPRCVKIGDRLFLNDGIIALQVTRIDGTDIHCRILVGGELRSRKGLNLPGIDLGISAFTSDDRAWLEFAAEQRIDAVSQSFVACAEDIEAVRREAASLNFSPFIIAKIERSNARIAETTDGPGKSFGKTGDHGHPDAALHGGESAADPGGSHRCRQCDTGRDRLRHAFRRVRHGPLAGRIGKDAGTDRGRNRTTPTAVAPAGSVEDLWPQWRGKHGRSDHAQCRSDVAPGMPQNRDRSHP
jgi:hypothetical protein